MEAGVMCGPGGQLSAAVQAGGAKGERGPAQP